jgi:hypothetical protein
VSEKYSSSEVILSRKNNHLPADMLLIVDS